jgi:hypothetical protein
MTACSRASGEARRQAPDWGTLQPWELASLGVCGVSEDDSVERLSVTEAAERLGVTRDAIHKRIRMGSIEHEQGADGRFYVYVDTSTTAADTSTDVTIDDRTDLLIAEMQDRIRSLEEANRENRRIIAALTSRIPPMEAPASPESPQAPETATEQPGRVEPQAAVESQQEATETATDEQQGRGPIPDTAEGRETGSERPWWRRVFGG